MIVKEKEIIINNILLEMKDKEYLLDDYIKSSILKNDFSKIENWINDLNNGNLIKFKRLLIELNELKDTNLIVEIWDDFLVGHCHNFAVALNILFGYKIGIIHGKSKGIFGEELEHLFHAFAIDDNNQAYDVEGKYSYLNAIENYKKQENPKTGNIADEVNVLFFNNVNEFKSNFSLVDINEDFVIKGIKRISSNPLNYYNTKRIRTNIQLPSLEVNKDYLPSGDKYYSLKEGKRLYQKLSIEAKKQFKDLGIWKINGIHSTFKGLIVELGLGSFDFDMLSIEFEIDWKENSLLSNKESEENLINYFKNFNWALIEENIQKTIKK